MKGAIAAGHPKTAEAGVRMYEAGGNAFDAVLAALAAACVVEPVLTSLGGGGFLLARQQDHHPLLFDFFVQTPRQRRDEKDTEFYPIIADFGTDKHTMILQNHGIMVCADSVRQAWTRLYGLEKSMQAQLLAMASGAPLRMPSEDTCAHVAAQWDKGDATDFLDGWESHLRLLDRADPTWKH